MGAQMVIGCSIGGWRPTVACTSAAAAAAQPLVSPRPPAGAAGELRGRPTYTGRWGSDFRSKDDTYSVAIFSYNAKYLALQPYNAKYLALQQCMMLQGATTSRAG